MFSLELVIDKYLLNLLQDLASVVNDLAATNLDGAYGTDLTGLSNGPIQAADTDKKPSKAQKRRVSIHSNQWTYYRNQ